jgi:hypothetical protein
MGLFYCLRSLTIRSHREREGVFMSKIEYDQPTYQDLIDEIAKIIEKTNGFLAILTQELKKTLQN